MFSIAFGIVAGVFAVALTQGLIEQRISESIELETGHVQIHNVQYLEEQETGHFLEGMADIQSQLNALPEVGAATYRTKITAMAMSANGNAGIQLIGIDPEEEKTVFGLSEKLTDGAYFEGIKRNPILISQRTAEKLKLKLRSKVVLTMQDNDHEIVGGAFRVVGIFKTSNSGYDQGNMFVRKSDLQRIVKLDEVHEVVIKATEGYTPEQTKEAIATVIPSTWKEQTWAEIMPELAYYNESGSLSSLIILGIIFLALAFAILNTMLMVVLERVQEIGVLMAVGMGRLKIFSMIVLETVFLSLVGGVVGLLLSYGLIEYFGKNGIDIENSEGYESLGFSSVIYPEISPEFYPQVAIAVVIVAIASSIFPAVKALKLKPNEAIKGHL
ncbi:ABC transporter permease [Algivirga pacifica]|uniref:ABC transporter permease n=2 Tax=Algivirga pacifica TaxID=1162670 RepID=A0ABP9D497_9BACT